MRRRPLGNGRRLASIGALVTILGCLLPWYVLGGDGGLPQLSYGAFDDGGILVFLAGLATLALVLLPYAASPRSVAVDNAVVYGALAVLAAAGLALFVLSPPTLLEAPEGLLPDRAYGFWIAVVGTIILGRAAYDVALEPPRI